MRRLFESCHEYNMDYQRMTDEKYILLVSPELYWSGQQKKDSPCLGHNKLRTIITMTILFSSWISKNYTSDNKPSMPTENSSLIDRGGGDHRSPTVAYKSSSSAIIDNHHHHDSSNTDSSHSQSHGHGGGSFISEKVPLYSAPRQRQRWNETQVLPHVNWVRRTNKQFCVLKIVLLFSQVFMLISTTLGDLDMRFAGTFSSVQSTSSNFCV